MSLPTFSEGWVFAGFLVGILAGISYFKTNPIFNGVGYFLKVTAAYVVPIVAIGLWLILSENGYAHPLGSFSGGIWVGFFFLTIGAPIVLLGMSLLVVLGNLIYKHIPPRTKTDRRS